jgi:hypothetical protein
MSLDAGGLAQMTYNHHNSFASGLGVPGTGFASRGKGTHIKRLSVAPPSQITTIDETQQSNPTPRTSRSHLLAGLRTAPKSPTFPTSAPPTQLRHYGPEQSRLSAKGKVAGLRGVPHTALGATFPSHQQDHRGMGGQTQMYSLPEQVLAPPVLPVGGTQDDAAMDPEFYAELVATNQYLAQQQMRLQQQLINVTAAAQQLQGLNLNGGMLQQQAQYVQSPLTMNTGYYNQQLQNGLQPIVQPVPHQPGVYSVYNPMTGQYGYVVDNNPRSHSVASQTILHTDLSHSPPPLTPTFRAEVSPPPDSSMPVTAYRSNSPPKSNSPSSVNADPLPPPSENSFRPSHKKASSFAMGFGEAKPSAPEGMKSTLPKSAGFPQTSMTGTFGPGQSRAGDHPIRQPRGPPSLEELIAKPTAKYEGSKNFATRQRRAAVHNLVRAGMERRGASRGSGSFDSLGSSTPASESEIAFSISSDNDSDGLGSHRGSLSGQPSVSSLRSMNIGAIGSERKEMRDRSKDRHSIGGGLTAGDITGEEGTAVEDKLGETNADESTNKDERRRTPLLVLTNAEKRKSSLF